MESNCLNCETSAKPTINTQSIKTGDKVKLNISAINSQTGVSKEYLKWVNENEHKEFIVSKGGSVCELKDVVWTFWDGYLFKIKVKNKNADNNVDKFADINKLIEEIQQNKIAQSMKETDENYKKGIVLPKNKIKVGDKVKLNIKYIKLHPLYAMNLTIEYIKWINTNINTTFTVKNKNDDNCELENTAYQIWEGYLMKV